jgi:peptide deformylase
LGTGTIITPTRLRNEERTVISRQRPPINGAIGERPALTPLYARLKSPGKASIARQRLHRPRLREIIMAVRDILKLPDKRLRLKSEPVKQIDSGIRALVNDMFETMYAAPGIGLAAIQVGVAKRVVTMDLSKKEGDHKPQVFINPEVTWKSDEMGTYEEGCLSIPEYYEEVERPAEVKVKYLDIDGKTHEIKAKGLLATCLQHEIDHTNGVLFIDHLSRLKRNLVIKKFTKAAKKEEA